MRYVNKLQRFPLGGNNIKKLFWNSYKYLFFNVVDVIFQRQIFKFEKDTMSLITFQSFSPDLPELQDLEGQPLEFNLFDL